MQHGFGDPSRDLAAVLLSRRWSPSPARASIGLTDAPGDGPRLQDLVDGRAARGDRARRVRLLDRRRRGPDGAAAASLESANAAANPSARLASVEAAYWTDVGTREHLRWVMPHDEEPLLDALARLHVAGRTSSPRARGFVGMFRAHGLLVPVWDLPSGTGAGGARGARGAARRGDLEAALADTSPLSADERAGPHGLANRQLTIR